MYFVGHNPFIPEVVNNTNMTKVRFYCTVTKEMAQWVDDRIKIRKFHNRSHAVEVALAKLIESEKGE